MTGEPRARDAPRRLGVVRLGRRPYAPVLDLQRRLARERREGTRAEDLLLLVEHEPVVTLGRGADEANVLARTAGGRSIDVVDVERGGDVTYHGPGQLVGYPILDLHAYRLDLHWYLRRLEEVLLRAIGESGLPGFRVEGYTGVWTGDAGGPPWGAVRPDGAAPPDAVTPPDSAARPDAVTPPDSAARPDAATLPHTDDGFPTIPAAAASDLVLSGAIRKIASIGVHASRWVTWHGFALNVTEEPLAAFPAIVPCGIDGVRMTSLAHEGGVRTLDEAAAAVLRGFDAAFGCRTEIGDESAI